MMAYMMVPCAICGRSVPLLDSREVEQVCTTCMRWIINYDSLLKWKIPLMRVFDGDLSKHWER